MNVQQLQRMTITDIARVCHEVNAAYCKSIGDDSQVPWRDSPEWQKLSAIDGVTFHIANPTATPEGSHKEWFKAKLKDGWTYGEHKDAKLKTHPCMLAYNDLPTYQRIKDYLFQQVITSLTPFL